VLIEAYPRSEQIANADGMLPLHCACSVGTAATVEYLYRVYPAAVNYATGAAYPIHLAMEGMKLRDNPVAAVDIVKFLLDCDPNVKLQKVQGRLSLLYWACGGNHLIQT